MVHLAISRAGVELSPGSEVILRPHTWPITKNFSNAAATT